MAKPIVVATGMVATRKELAAAKRERRTNKTCVHAIVRTDKLGCWCGVCGITLIWK